MVETQRLENWHLVTVCFSDRSIDSFGKDSKLSTLSVCVCLLFFFFKKGKKITVCLNKCDTSVTYVSWSLLLPAYPFLLTIFVSQWLSKSAGAHTISTQTARCLTCFLFISCPRWIYSYCPYTQPTWGRILGESSLLNFSLWHLYSLLCPTPRHKFHCVQLLLRAGCIFLLLLFVRSACKIEFILSRKGPQLLLVGEGGTHRKAAELQCTMLWICKILFKGLNL